MKILVTGCAGFIGFHFSKRLIKNDHTVVGIDNFNNYYDVNLKRDRCKILKQKKNFRFLKLDLVNKKKLQELFDNERFDYVINLAAQAGVRYSLENPQAYIDSNINGFLNILECCRHSDIKHLIFASSSSVYGMNKKKPFSISDPTDYPISLYATTKKSNELMAFTYSHLFNIPCTGLRFFTVYGPFGRPDMAYFSFTKRIMEGKSIDVFNNGKMKRDFTYIDDIVVAMEKLLPKIPLHEYHPNTLAKAAYKIFNIGNNNPVTLDRFIKSIEEPLQIKAIKRHLEMQKGDVPETFADVEELENIIDFKPKMDIERGMERFITWYREYYH